MAKGTPLPAERAEPIPEAGAQHLAPLDPEPCPPCLDIDVDQVAAVLHVALESLEFGDTEEIAGLLAAAIGWLEAA